MSVIIPIDEPDHLISLYADKRQGRLNGRIVRQILVEEKEFFLSHIVTKTCCGISYHQPVDWADVRHFGLPQGTRHLYTMIIPAIFNLFCLIIGLTVVLERSQDYSKLFSAFLLVAGVGCIFHCQFLICKTSDRLIPSSAYKKNFVDQVLKRIKIVEDFLNEIDDRDNVSPHKLAKLILAIALDKEEELLDQACVWEFREILEECEKAGFFGLLLSDSKRALRALLRNPPNNPDQFHEMVLRAGSSIQTEDDLYELRISLPQNDIRLNRLVLKTADFDSAQSSEDALDDAKSDCLESFVLIGDEPIEVDTTLLKNESKWFAAFDKFRGNDSEISLSADAPFKEELILILKQLDNFPAGSGSFMHLFDCLVYYRFDRIVQEFGIKTLNANQEEPFLTLEQEMRIAGAIAAEMSPCIIDSLQNLLILTTSHPADERRYCAWMDFGMQYFQGWLIPYYTGFFLGLKKNDPIIMKAVFKRRDQFPPQVMSKIQKAIRLYFSEFNGIYPGLLDDADFMSWLAREMKGREEEFFYTRTFKQVWESCSGNPKMKKAMGRFASSRKFEIMNAWAAGTVPVELLRLLPI